MSRESSSIAETLTAGIQDISALLPIIGTEQCEAHVGSALEGGYIYAAATSLSIFGSLGIVKTGISVLVSSVSLPRPAFSLTAYKLPRVSIRSSRGRWLGARVLDNAGFKPAGTVAPMIGMDASRFKAETRLLEILEDKHIDTPEKALINWRIRNWNIGLVLCTLITAALSVVPYIHLILRDISQPVLVPWIFPLLRTAGSSLAVMCCQFLIQSRIVILMKHRVIFAIIDRLLINELKSGGEQDPETVLREQKEFQWNPDFPAEECLWSLKQWLHQLANPSNPTQPPIPPTNDSDSNTLPSPSHTSQALWNTSPSLPPSKEDNMTTGTNEVSRPAPHVSLPMESLIQPMPILNALAVQQQRHFPDLSIYSPHLHLIFLFSSWIVLFFSLPAAIAGYIGCFTLVSSSTSRNGPLIWLGLEAALSILRILLWAANPSFDERTELTVEIELSRVQPLVTTEMDVDVVAAKGNILDLVPERQFLEHITLFTGPLRQFPTPENCALYFTLSATSVTNPKQAVSQERLFMTALDLSTRTSITLYLEGGSLVYSDSLINCDSEWDGMQAELKSRIPEEYSRRRKRLGYFEHLDNYYFFILRALFEHRANEKSAVLQWRWSLSEPATPNRQPNPPDHLPRLSELDHWYLVRGYEHHLKTKLIENWGRWITEEMEAMQSIGLNDCYYYLTNPNSRETKVELHLLTHQLLDELLTREMALSELSCQLEDILNTRIESCPATDGGGLGEWHLSVLELGKRKRLQEESELAKKRMEKFFAAPIKIAEASERSGDFRQFQLHCQSFIEELWAVGNDGSQQWTTSYREYLQEWLRKLPECPWSPDHHHDSFSKDLLKRFSSWKHFNQREDMENMIKQVEGASFDELEKAYKYEWPSRHLAFALHSKFLHLNPLSEVSSRERIFAAKHSSPAVVDLENCNIEVIREVIQKPSCRSVLGVDLSTIKDISKVDYLFYVGCASGDITPPFALQNRARWWQEPESNSINSSVVYFTALAPQKSWFDDPGASACTRNRAIARIMIYIHSPARPRLRFVHYRHKDIVAVSIMESHKQLRLIQNNEIPLGTKFGILDIELSQFERGKHELEVVVASKVGEYYLRDIAVDVSVTLSEWGDMTDPVPTPRKDTGEDIAAEIGRSGDSDGINKSEM